MIVLWLLGALSAAVYYVAYTRRFPLADHYDKLSDLGALGGTDALAAAKYLGPIALLFVLYAAALWWARRVRGWRGLLPVYAGAIAFAAIAAFEFPVTAIDLFVYLVNGRQWTLHGTNPLVAAPDTVPDDPFLGLAGQYAHVPSPYGPVWVVIVGLPTLLFGDRLFAGLMTLKAIAASAYLGCAVVLSWTLARHRPTDVVAGTLFFAWNPLVVLDGVANGHNDAAMMLPALVGLALALRGRDVPGLAFLALSAGVKYSSALLIPVVVLHHARRWPDWQNRLRHAAAAAIVTVGAFLICYAPFWAGPATFAGLLKRNDVQLGSVAALANYLRREYVPAVPPEDVAYGFALGFFVYYGWKLWRVWRHERDWPVVGHAVLFGSMFAPVWFNSWFVIWPLALAALGGCGRDRVRSGVLSLTSLLGAFFFTFSPVWNTMGWDTPHVHVLAAPFIFGPPLVASLRWPGTRSAELLRVSHASS